MIVVPLSLFEDVLFTLLNVLIAKSMSTRCYLIKTWSSSNDANDLEPFLNTCLGTGSPFDLNYIQVVE